MSQFKVEFTLKQHTPIIHFQSEQTGATLRATELKPKLDSFLLEHMNSSKSLDYKVKIEQNFSHAQEINSKESLFFGNMGDDEPKKYKIYPNKFKIEFFSFKSEIIEAIKKYFEAFLANTNFGTRQSKGYGGFYISEKPFNKSLIDYKVYSFSTKSWEKDIKVLYSFFRQGINLPNRNGTRFYSKPAIFSFAKSKGWTWDKKAIKQKYFLNRLEQQFGEAVEYQSSESYIVRDLFGLSSDQSWMSYKTTISKENKEIERFKSPITFKVIDGDVYFWANETVQQVLGQEFKVLSNKKGDLILKAPNEFSFDDFFTFTFNLDLSKHIESTYHNQPEYLMLTKIFKDIKGAK